MSEIRTRRGQRDLVETKLPLANSCRPQESSPFVLLSMGSVRCQLSILGAVEGREA